MNVKCKCCDKLIPKEEAIRVQEKGDLNGYFCYCSKKCLIKYMIDELMEE